MICRGLSLRLMKVFLSGFCRISQTTPARHCHFMTLRRRRTSWKSFLVKCLALLIPGKSWDKLSKNCELSHFFSLEYLSLMWCLFLLRLIQPAGKSYFTSSLGAQLYFLSLKSAAVGQALSGCDKRHLGNEGLVMTYCIVLSMHLMLNRISS